MHVAAAANHLPDYSFRSYPISMELLFTEVALSSCLSSILTHTFCYTAGSEPWPLLRQTHTLYLQCFTFMSLDSRYSERLRDSIPGRGKVFLSTPQRQFLI
jgi:hypothetical protein